MSERDVREKGEKIFLSQREKERGVKGESVSMIRKKASVKLVSGHWLFKKFAFEFSSRLLQSFFLPVDCWQHLLSRKGYYSYCL